MSENDPIVIPDSNGAPSAMSSQRPLPMPGPFTAREVGRQLAEEMINRRALAGTRTVEEYKAMSDGDLEYELEDMPIKDSCDVVRRKIRAFLDSGEMKVGEFQNAINTNSNTYSRFMSQNGPYKGAGSTVYGQAWMFFKKRELRGIKPPRHPIKPKKGEEAAAAEAQAGPILAAVELPGESEDRVEVYDTCDEIRRKINAHLKKPGITQAQFLRDIATSYKRAPRKIQSTQLSAFRSKKGAYDGNTSAVYYGAYVFFEKMRIADKKPKSKKRQEMEEIHGMNGGMDTERKRERFWCAQGTAPHMDKYGQLHIVQTMSKRR